MLAEVDVCPGCTLLKVGDPNDEEKTFYLAIATDDEVSIALPLEYENGVYEVVSRSDVRRLFVAFPLFGTESVPFPFMMNSLDAPPRGKGWDVEP